MSTTQQHATEMRAMKVFRLYVIADVAFRVAIVFVTQALPSMAIPPEGVAKDMKKAVHFFTIAAEAGHPKANFKRCALVDREKCTYYIHKDELEKSA